VLLLFPVLIALSRLPHLTSDGVHVSPPLSARQQVVHSVVLLASFLVLCLSLISIFRCINTLPELQYKWKDYFNYF
jgi:hypothetical protein